MTGYDFTCLLFSVCRCTKHIVFKILLLLRYHIDIPSNWIWQLKKKFIFVIYICMWNDVNEKVWVCDREWGREWKRVCLSNGLIKFFFFCASKICEIFTLVYTKCESSKNRIQLKFQLPMPINNSSLFFSRRTYIICK